MEVITITNPALYVLVEIIIKRVLEELKQQDKYVPEKEALRILGLRSKTSLWQRRVRGDICYTKYGKIIMYERASLLKFQDEHKIETF